MFQWRTELVPHLITKLKRTSPTSNMKNPVQNDRTIEFGKNFIKDWYMCHLTQTCSYHVYCGKSKGVFFQSIWCFRSILFDLYSSYQEANFIEVISVILFDLYMFSKYAPYNFDTGYYHAENNILMKEFQSTLANWYVPNIIQPKSLQTHKKPKKKGRSAHGLPAATAGHTSSLYAPVDSN